MRILIALGGNALLERHDRPDSDVQLTHVRVAAGLIAPLTRDHDVVITHGNGPQVGLLAAESDGDASLARPYPLDALDAETQGLIGYWLQRELANAGCVKPIATLVTQTVVAADDPAFAAPTKFIGPSYDATTARALEAGHGWTVARDGDGWRRVVPSPRPVDVIEVPLARKLSGLGVVVICGGGGGAAVSRGPQGLTAQEAIVDKDLVSALLAEELGADLFVLLTDVTGILTDYGTPEQQLLRATTPQQLRALSLPAGSMGPKAEAVASFVERTAQSAAIGALADLGAVVAGSAGTQIRPDQQSAGQEVLELLRPALDRVTTEGTWRPARASDSTEIASLIATVEARTHSTIDLVNLSPDDWAEAPSHVDVGQRHITIKDFNPIRLGELELRATDGRRFVLRIDSQGSTA